MAGRVLFLRYPLSSILHPRWRNFHPRRGGIRRLRPSWKDALQRDAVVQDQLRHHVVMRQAAAGRSYRLESHCQKGSRGSVREQACITLGWNTVCWIIIGAGETTDRL